MSLRSPGVILGYGYLTGTGVVVLFMRLWDAGEMPFVFPQMATTLTVFAAIVFLVGKLLQPASGPQGEPGKDGRSARIS